MLRKITSLKLDYDSRLPEMEYDEIYDGDDIDHKKLDPEGRNRRVHDDLVNAVTALTVHLATLTEQYPFSDMEDNPDLLKKFKVTGFSIGGKNEHEGVTLIGQRLLEGNKVLNLVAPFTKFHPTHSTYIYIGSLTELIQRLQKEGNLYVDGEKRGPDAQLSLDLPEKPKKERKKKGLKEVVEDLQEEGIEIKMAVNH